VITFSETSNDHALCCVLHHGHTPVQLLHCLPLSSCQIEWTLPPASQLFLSQSQQSYLVRHHLRLSNLLERISRPSCEQLYVTNTSHRKQETFLNEYPFHWDLMPTKEKHNKTLLFGNILLKQGTIFYYWNQSLNMRMWVCYLDCHEVGLCC
jgi:hypothetical protein